MKIVKVTPLTPRGKTLVNKHGDEWTVVTQTPSIIVLQNLDDDVIVVVNLNTPHFKINEAYNECH